MAAYVIAQVRVTSPERYAEYSSRVAETVTRHGGAFMARGGRSEVLEGSVDPGRNVIIRFDSYEAARRWYDSPEYQAILPIRLANSDGLVILTEGV